MSTEMLSGIRDLKDRCRCLSNVQHRATRMVPALRSLTYEQRLRHLDLSSLVYRRFRGDSIEVYKYLHGLYEIDNSNFLPLHTSVGMATRGHSLKLLKKQCSTNLRRNFFTLRVVNTWNSMPEEIVRSTSVNCFKGRFDRFWCHLRYETDENKVLAPALR